MQPRLPYSFYSYISNLVNVPCSLEYESSVKSEAPPPISNNEWLILKAATFKHFYSVYLEVDLSYIKDIKQDHYLNVILKNIQDLWVHTSKF